MAIRKQIMIPRPPKTGNKVFDTWTEQIVVYLENWLKNLSSNVWNNLTLVGKLTVPILDTFMSNSASVGLSVQVSSPTKITRIAVSFMMAAESSGGTLLFYDGVSTTNGITVTIGSSKNSGASVGTLTLLPDQILTVNATNCYGLGGGFAILEFE